MEVNCSTFDLDFVRDHVRRIIVKRLKRYLSAIVCHAPLRFQPVFSDAIFLVSRVVFVHVRPIETGCFRYMFKYRWQIVSLNLVFTCEFMSRIRYRGTGQILKLIYIPWQNFQVRAFKNFLIIWKPDQSVGQVKSACAFQESSHWVLCF